MHMSSSDVSLVEQSHAYDKEGTLSCATRPKNIDSLFSGVLTSLISCQCGKGNMKSDPIQDISLEIDGDTNSLQEMFDKFLSRKICQSIHVRDASIKTLPRGGLS